MLRSEPSPTGAPHILFDASGLNELAKSHTQSHNAESVGSDLSGWSISSLGLESIDHSTDSISEADSTKQCGLEEERNSENEVSASKYTAPSLKGKTCMLLPDASSVSQLCKQENQADSTSTDANKNNAEDNVTVLEPTSPQVYRMVSERACFARLGFEYRFCCKRFTKDLAKSYECYERAANSGSADSLTALAVSHLFGIGCYISKRKAHEYLRRAMLQDSVDATEVRALCWMTGILNGKRDYTVALELLQTGVAQNSSACLIWAGFTFELGLGTDPDPIIAVQAYSAASESAALQSIVSESYPGALSAKDPWMLLKMALFLLHSDQKIAFRGHAMDCLKQAAFLGFSDAKVYLALCLLHGKWLEKDRKAGLQWLRAAAKDEPPHPIAVRILAKL